METSPAMRGDRRNFIAATGFRRAKLGLVQSGIFELRCLGTAGLGRYKPRNGSGST